MRVVSAVSDLHIAQELAAAITVNCDRHLAGDISRDRWSAEQSRLWNLVEYHDCYQDVMQIVAPDLIAHARESR